MSVKKSESCKNYLTYHCNPCSGTQTIRPIHPESVSFMLHIEQLSCCRLFIPSNNNGTRLSKVIANLQSVCFSRRPFIKLKLLNILGGLTQLSVTKSFQILNYKTQNII